MAEFVPPTLRIGTLTVWIDAVNFIRVEHNRSKTMAELIIIRGLGIGDRGNGDRDRDRGKGKGNKEKGERRQGGQGGG
jgi:hypothetical protein